MFGPFRPSSTLFGGLLWKIPWRLSPHQKRRQRKRLRLVDNVVAVLDTALARQAGSNAPLSITTTASFSGSQSIPLAAQTINPVWSSSASGPPTSTIEQATSSDPNAIGSPLRLRTFSEQQKAMGRSIYSTNTTGQGMRKYQGVGAMKAVERWKAEMPTEEEMLPRDKYTMFDRKERKYRKGIHKLPKWTRVSQRVNPPGY